LLSPEAPLLQGESRYRLNNKEKDEIFMPRYT
jgi:hypothetical protein